MVRSGFLSDESIKEMFPAFYPNKKFKIPYYDIFDTVQYDQATRTGSLSARANLQLENYQKSLENTMQRHQEELQLNFEAHKEIFELRNPHLKDVKNLPYETKAFLGESKFFFPDYILFRHKKGRISGEFRDNSLEAIKQRAIKDKDEDLVNAIENFEKRIPETSLPDYEWVEPENFPDGHPFREL